MTNPVVQVVGDPYMPAEVFARGLEPLSGRIALRTRDITRSDTPDLPGTAAVSEYAGDPLLVVDAARGSEVLVVHGAPVTEDVLATPGLRLVCCARGGPVNVDLAAATERGIPVTGAPGKNATAVAELTIALVLALVRTVPAASDALRRTGAPGSAFDGVAWFGAEAADVTLGLVGTGRVGSEVAVRARALGFRVLGHDPAGVADPGVEPVGDLAELLERADVVSLHARASPGDPPLIGAAELARMRPGALLVNTARESLLDERALLAALRSGRIGGAALDVLHTGVGRNPLLDEPSVLATPHIGGATGATLTRGARLVAEAVAAHLDGTALPYLCNPAVLDDRRGLSA